MNSLKLRLTFIAGLTLLAIYGSLPSVLYFTMPKDKRNDPNYFESNLPSWLPRKHVTLGLDLQGGVQFVLGVQASEAAANKLSRLGSAVLRWKDEAKVAIKTAFVPQGSSVLRLELEEGADADAVRDAFHKEFSGLVQVTRDAKYLDFGYSDEQLKEIRRAAIEQAERVVRTRVDKWGVAEPLIARRANNSILVQLPGFSDTERAKDLLGRTAQLAFKIVDDEFRGFDALATGPLPDGITVERGGSATPQFLSQDKVAVLAFLKDKLPPDRAVLFEREPLAGEKWRFRSYVVDAATQLTGDDILDAFAGIDSNGLDQSPVVHLRFTGPGGKRFADITGANVGKRMAIVLDDEVNSSPEIRQKITGGEAVITLGGVGNYQKQADEANQLAMILKSGALPATITIEEERQVGATLGPELAQEGIYATAIGIALVFLFMVLYYRRPGFIACFALLLNAIFLLAAMAVFGFSLTLPGIAGFVLTLGMAVDANVLINERIRQEIAEGKNSRKAVDNGFGKVLWTVLDSNITTLIAAAVLLETTSSGPIKGFAVTLIVGLLISLFTSLYCTQTMFEFVMSRARNDADLRAWLGAATRPPREFKIGFLRISPVAGAVATLVFAAFLIGSSTRGFNWSVDFAGGTEIEVAFANPVDTDKIVAAAEAAKIADPSIQAIGAAGDRFLVRFSSAAQDSSESATTDTAQEAGAAAEMTDTNLALSQRAKEQLTAFRSNIASTLAADKPEFLKVDYVGPRVGRELRAQAMLSVLYSVIGILLYIALRFDSRFAPGTVLKILIDVAAVLVAHIVFDWSFDLTSVAAVLTVVGYSVNDTIVIYDRIRENLQMFPRRSMAENIDRSLNETLGRSINTSVVSVLSIIGILVSGSQSIWIFAAAMAIGIASATLTTQFLSSAVVHWVDRYRTTHLKAKVPAHS